MPKIHMIFGPVGCGKTTFSKKLEQEIKAVRFSPDEWMVELFGFNPPAEHFPSYCEKIKNVLWSMVERTIKTDTDVILDFGFWKRSERDDVRQRAKEWGADVKLYSLKCPPNVRQQRVLARTSSQAKGALYIDANIFDILEARVEPIDPSEGKCVLIETPINCD